MARVPVSAHPFVRLTPDVVIEAVEQLGLHSDGRILALNSYENRVYQVGIDDGEPLVAKFHRPGRWSVPTIVEEHEFAYELTAAEIPVVAPIEQRGLVAALQGPRVGVERGAIVLACVLELDGEAGCGGGGG